MLTKLNKVWEELTTAFLCRSREEGDQGMHQDPEKLNDQRVTLLFIQIIQAMPKAQILDRTKIQIQRQVFVVYLVRSISARRWLRVLRSALVRNLLNQS